MIQLSPRGAAIYHLLTLTALLLPLYALGFMLSALTRQPAAAAFTTQVYKLTILTGFLGAGLLLAEDKFSAQSIIWLRRIWTALVLLTLALSPLAISPLLDGAAAVFLLLLLAASLSRAAPSIYFRVWQIGLLCSAGALLAAQLDSALSQALEAFQIQVAYPLCGLSVVFWLMGRYSTVEGEWARTGLRNVAGLLFFAGSLISLGALGLPAWLSLSAAPLVLLSYVILANHSYRALRQRNKNATLAPHWSALATLFWLVGGGFLGALSLQSDINTAMRGTELAAAQTWLAQWVLLAIVLAFINDTASALRGANRRITGYAPFWLIAFGVAFSGMLQACYGVVWLYLRAAAVDAATATELLLPLRALWQLCLLPVAAGLLFYAFGFWLRRPRIRISGA